MTMDTIRELQAYGYVFGTGLLCFIMYSYLYHMFKSEKTGRRNFEKYGNIALNDDIHDAPIESRDIVK